MNRSDVEANGRPAGHDDPRKAYAIHAHGYTAYANGDPVRELLDFGSRHFAYGDQVVWEELLLPQLKRALRTTPAGHPVRVLDAGCGDGVWALRVANHLEAAGRPYEVLGIDLTPEMLAQAREHLRKYEGARGKRPDVTFAVGNLEEPLPYPDDSFALTMTLYTVLNHIRRAKAPVAASELLRVTRPGGRHVSVVKAPGGAWT